MVDKPKIVVLRFSAMGDVAMTVPVLKELVQQHPEVELLIVSRKLFRPFFKSLPQNTFHAIEPNSTHKGISGLYRLFKELRKYPLLAVADLHQNLRSRFLTLLFSICGIKTATIDKGRKEKKELIERKNNRLRPLKPTTERYADVFRALGYPLTLSHQLQPDQLPLPANILAITGKRINERWVGIAPFAQHISKVYPLHKMEQVVAALAKKGYRLFVFGGGPQEQECAESWASSYPGVISIIGKLSIEDELALISNLNLMLSMDSAGMHMASLQGVPVVSVWGSTHPFIGFLGYGQSLDDCVQRELPCRPWSVYGNKMNAACYLECMEELPERMIIDKVINKLGDA